MPPTPISSMRRGQSVTSQIARRIQEVAPEGKGVIGSAQNGPSPQRQ